MGEEEVTDYVNIGRKDGKYCDQKNGSVSLRTNTGVKINNWILWLGFGRGIFILFGGRPYPPHPFDIN